MISYAKKIFQARKARRRKALKKQWLDTDKIRYFDSIETYFRLTCPAKEAGVVDDKVWLDLDMNTVFGCIDATQTDIGQQYLYKKLRVLNSDEIALRQNFYTIEKLRANESLRNDLLASLKYLEKGSASILAKIIFGARAYTKISRALVSIWAVFSVVAIVWSIVYSGYYVYLLLSVVVVNFTIAQVFEQKTEAASGEFYYLKKLLSASCKIANNKNVREIPQCIQLHNGYRKISRVNNRIHWMSLSQGSDNLVVSNVAYIFNLLCVYDILVYAYSAQLLTRNIGLIRDCFECIGAIDANMEIASYVERCGTICKPNWVAGQHFDLLGVYHPLVEDSVANDFISAGKSSVVTGSNMAGKTTFIKTIGVNLILSRTLFICHASRADMPMIDIHSSIKNTDALEDGLSYYFSELIHIKAFLNLPATNPSSLILIDEIFRGTNTTERIAGSVAVLEALAKNNIVLVTTHDVELEHYLVGQYDLWHFEETGDSKQPFDYRLKPGVCRSTNALKLMENIDYPEHITRRAQTIVATMS